MTDRIVGSRARDQVQVARGARDLWAAMYELFLEKSSIYIMSDAYVPGCYRSIYSALPPCLCHSDLHDGLDLNGWIQEKKVTQADFALKRRG